MPLPKSRVTCRKSNILKPKDCCAPVVSALDQHLTIPIQGKLTQTDLISSLVGMAVMNQSVHSITHILDRVPCETSVRYHLKKLDMADLEQNNTSILTTHMHHVLKPGYAYQFAIDFTNDPYYGSTDEENEAYIVRSKRKKSTNEFYSYITLYVTTRNRQMTLAVFPVRRDTSKVGYIAQCLDRITELGLRIEVLCLDREFYTRKVLGFLMDVQVPFIVPVRKHGKRMKQVLQGTHSRYAEYRMHGKPVLVLKIAIAVKYAKGKRGKRGVENLGYVVGNLRWNPHRVHQTYRSRFSIESSYRMRNQVKPRTSTKNPVIRYLYAIISFLLKNIWIDILWKHFSPAKQGPQTIEVRGFRFSSFMCIIWEAIRTSMRGARAIPVLRYPV
ncbi:ISH3 family transposase [Methanofollis tationis]|uniref:ISH3 family transposase n=2 Tax=Methanofollis tationis TaxID=81417 RepID=A0A7K4HME7_9EURY|nr:ISH3 family transposase [Methanofollis tationis]NVO66436.1 ISH3 family transposase [Methanofollis tationis]NVO66700.1 ISH3 family transposase [Methanofollis tationis]